MLPVAEARAQILDAFAPLPGELVSLTEGLGRVLAEDLSARVTQPPRDVSAMDGYAVRADDVAKVPATLTVVGDIPAGGDYSGTLNPGEAVRIYTGAPVPAGADAIVIQEDTSRDGDRVTVNESAARGRYLRPAGLDFTAGTVGLKAGRLLTSRDIGLAAAMNHPWLKVRRRPRVAVLATGDEVVLPGEALGASQIVSSNGFALAAFVTACGGEAVNLGIAPDDEAALSRDIDAARGCDLLLTSGGASVGAHDLVQDVLKAKGAELGFWKIAMRPGKPLMFGRLDGVPVLGLPGNPVSGLVCATVFLRPALDRLLGLGGHGEEVAETAILGRDLPENDRRQEYLRARLETDRDGRRRATPFDKQDSAMLSALAAATCLVVRPPHAPAAKVGESVEIIPLNGGCLGI